MYEESLGGPPASMPGHGHNLPLTSDYGLHPNGSYPRHGTHQRLPGAYSPSLTSSGLLPAMLAREGISQSRPASPHMSQFNFQSQTDVYTGGYPESEVDILESAGSTAPPNAPRFNLPSFPSIHNLPRSSAHRTVRYYVAVPHTLSDIYSLERVLSHVLPPFGQQVVSCIAIAAPTTRRIRCAEKGKLRADNPSGNIEVCYLYSLFSLK